MKRIYLKSLPVDLAAPDELMEYITAWLKKPERFRQIVTMNASMVMAAQTHPELARVIYKADLVTVDGYGIAKAIERQGQAVPPRLPGVALTRKLLDWCAAESRRIFLYGGTQPTVRKLRAVMETRWPALADCVIRNGYTTGDIRREVVLEQPDLLLVGLGTPAQELWIDSLAQELKHTVAIGVGGSFEVIAGLRYEAPQFIRECGLEWAYRMLQDPGRLRRIPQLVQFWYHYLRQ